MEDRPQQIRESAGLVESRLNTEFIELARKYGTHALLAIALVSVGFWAYRRYEQSVANQIDNAFVELEAVVASANPNPNSLTDVADRYGDIRGVGAVARLRAADVYLGAVQKQLRIGTTVKPDGTLDPADGILGAGDRESYLANATQLYQRVLDETQGVEAKQLFAVSALFGLAAVAESSGNFSEAKGYYEKIIARTEGTTLEAHARVARARIADADRFVQLPTLLSKDRLPATPTMPEPTAPVVGSSPEPLTSPEPTPGPAPMADPSVQPPAAEPAPK